MDTGQRSARISLKTVHVHAFEHNAKSVTKVRNVSRLGSHPSSQFSDFPLLLLDEGMNASKEEADKPKR
jgi:hypothetical protein